jgi:hypothetical protein
VQTSTERAARLREEVGLFRVRETRRIFDLTVYVGVLGGARDSFVVRAQDLPVMDAALRTDVLSALVEATASDCLTAWWARPGLPEPHDLDLLWLAAARSAFGMHERSLDGCYALTRYGWLDVLTGERRAWKRLRL